MEKEKIGLYEIFATLIVLLSLVVVAGSTVLGRMADGMGHFFSRIASIFGFF